MSQKTETGIDVGEEGRNWVRESLSRGLSLSKAFLETGDLASWKHLALVPADTPTTVLLRPDGGGVGVENGLAILQQFIARESPRGVAIVEDELATPDDEWIANQGLEYPHFVWGEELYHWLPLDPRLSVDDLAGFLGESTSGYPTNMFLVERKSAETLQKGVPDRRQADEIARDVRAVVVSAYDDEASIAAVPS